ncbi:prepilin-type N-terminal cleavage/methylation domain-containing protein [bacterium]|nr:prepilin-type N-terminal cleavage/methylation domain-containing protein [bacterium]
MKRRNRGFTLLEVIMVSGIMAFMLASIGAMSICTMRCYDRATARTFMDTDAATAMQKIVSDVREASDYKIIGGGTRLRIIPPKKYNDVQQFYNRYEPDTANQFDYYLSDSSGTPGHDGTWLWRGKDNDRRAIMKDVEALDFEEDTNQSIAISVRVKPQCASSMDSTTLTERVVYLRNYSGKTTDDD